MLEHMFISVKGLRQGNHISTFVSLRGEFLRWSSHVCLRLSAGNDILIFMLNHSKCDFPGITKLRILQHVPFKRPKARPYWQKLAGGYLRSSHFQQFLLQKLEFGWLEPQPQAQIGIHGAVLALDALKKGLQVGMASLK